MPKCERYSFLQEKRETYLYNLRVGKDAFKKNYKKHS